MVLEYLAVKTNFLFETIPINHNDFPLFFCKDRGELSNICGYLKERGYIELVLVGKMVLIAQN